MGRNSSISWTDHTFNPWIGCTRVSPGCVNCYAETLMAKRYGRVEWGPKGARSRTSDQYWRQPVGWNLDAQQEGVRRRVFCASLADVFDEHPSILPEWRADLWALIEATPALDWLLLTKRPEAVLDTVPESWRTGLPGNVWMGTSVEDQRRAEQRIPELLKVPARIRFLSCEPLLEPVRLRGEWLRCPGGAPYGRGLSTTYVHAGGCCASHPAIGWVILGGESGPGARPCDVEWIRSVRNACGNYAVPVFIKQLGARPFDGTEEGRSTSSLRLHDAKGEDLFEWPADLRLREFPEARA